MTVESQSSSVAYVVTNTAIGTEYPITFPYIETTDVKAYYVYSIEGQSIRTDMVYGVDYSVTDQVFTTKIFIPIPIGGETKLAIFRSTELSQEILWVDGQAVYPPSIMKADDKLTFIVQELAGEISRSIRTSITEPEPPISTQELYTTLSEIAARAEAAVDVATEAAAKAVAAAIEAGLKLNEITDLSIVVKDLPYGSSATGSYDAATGVLTLSIPRGMTGEQGIVGPQGPQGEPGVIVGELDTIAFGNFRVNIDGILQLEYIGSGTVPAATINQATGQIELTF